MDASCGIRRFTRRLFGALVAASALSLLWSTAALAQSLGPVTDTSNSAGGAATSTVAQAVAPVVQNTTAPVAQTAAPIVQSAAPVVEAATAPVTQSAAPVVQAAAPVLETTTPVVAPLTSGALEAAAPLLAESDQIRSAVEPLVGPTASTLRPTSQHEPAAPSAARVVLPPEEESTSASAVPATTVAAPRGGASFASPHPTDPPLRIADRRLEPRAAQRLEWPAPQAPSAFMISSHERAAGDPKGTKAAIPRTPSPRSPSSPSVPSSLAAAFSGSGAPIFVAALVAALLLAAPGLSRRLRLELALWPLPIPLPSLERPG